MRFAQWVLVEHYRVKLDVRIVFSHRAALAEFCCGFVNNAFVIKVEVEQDLLVILGSQVYVDATRFEDAKSILKNVFKILLTCTGQVWGFLGGAVDSKRVALCNKETIDVLKITNGCLLS